MDVCLYEVFEEEERAIRSFLPHGLQAFFSPLTIQESGHTDPPAAIVSIRTQSIVPASWWVKIRAILTRSTGYDHVVAYLREAGSDIPAGYLPLYCSRAVAEHALMLWLALMRRLPLQIAHFHRFNRDGLTGAECRGKRLAVVGVGSIGIEVCRIGEALGMDVIGVDIVKRYASVRYEPVERALAEADVIVCAMNLTQENRGYFSYELLRKTKPGVVFVNIARGEFVDPNDLLRLLEEGHLGGVGLDVFPDEPGLACMLRGRAEGAGRTDEAIVRLAKRPDVICTPHNAFNTAEAVARKASQSVQQILHFLEHGTFLWNVPR